MAETGRPLLAAIDAAVARALPADWPRLPGAWLPACGGVQARHAVRLAAGTGQGQAPYLAVAAVPPFAERTGAVERDLAALVDAVLGRGATLLLLYEHEDDPNGWIREQIEFPHPRFLCLPCTRSRAGAPPGIARGRDPVTTAMAGIDPAGAGAASIDPAGADAAGEAYVTAPTGRRREPLSDTIRDLWSGDLFYHGPHEGVQTVGIETMRDTCRRCLATLETVTGIVFPDRQVADWTRPDWRYFQALLQLARIPDPVIPALAAAVEEWRAAGRRRLTIVRWHRSETVGYAYWAAECALCGTCRGDLPLMEERMQWLHDLESRRTGILTYRPLRLDVPRQALQELTWGAEVNPHARFLGWHRAGEERHHATVQASAGAWAPEPAHLPSSATASETFSPARPHRPGIPGSIAGDWTAGTTNGVAAAEVATTASAPAGLPAGPAPHVGLPIHPAARTRTQAAGSSEAAATAAAALIMADATAVIAAATTTAVTATDTTATPMVAVATETAIAPPTAVAAGRGQVRRLGEILASWLGRAGVRQHPPDAEETQNRQQPVEPEEKASA